MVLHHHVVAATVKIDPHGVKGVLAETDRVETVQGGLAKVPRESLTAHAGLNSLPI